MAVFVHLTSHRNIASILRTGIVPRKVWHFSRGVYALPVTPSFYLSHQWLRELRRFGGGNIVAVYFRIPDDELVEISDRDSLHASTTANEAVALMMGAVNDYTNDKSHWKNRKKREQRRYAMPAAAGYEVVIPRKIDRSEIIRTKLMPQVVGWRFFPRSKGFPPRACICCERGQYGIGKLQRSVEKAEANNQQPKAILFGRKESSFRRVERLRNQRQSAQNLTKKPYRE